METQQNIPAGYTTAQVAQRLGISQHEVARHIRNGSLSAILTDAGIYVIDPDSTHRFENNTRKKGRPWDAETSWTALLLLDGVIETELNYHRERRLRLKLGLATNTERVIDGYPRKSLHETIDELFLVPNSNGNCILREPIGLPQRLQGLSEMPPPIVVAADLATSVDARERRCGLDYLKRKLAEFRNS